MAGARKITVELTEPQFEALSAATSRADDEWEVELETADGTSARRTRERRRALDAGWSKIAGAWHSGARR